MWKIIVLVVLSVIIAVNANAINAKFPPPKNKTMTTTYQSLPSLISRKFKSLQNETDNKNCDKNCDKTSRKPKSLSGLSFLTGLGLGSLAGAAALSDPLANLIPNHQNIYANLYSKFSTTTKSPLAELNINFSADKLNKLGNFDQLSGLDKLEALDSSRINTASYPYALAISTNSLVNETLRSVQQVLEQLKDRLDQRESLNAEQSNARPQYDDIDEEDNSVDGFNQRAVFNCSTLQEIIRSAIAEEIARNHFNFLTRQAVAVNTTNNMTTTTTTTEKSTEAPTEAPTTTSSTTATPVHSGYYYGGHPQNIHGVDLTSYGPPAHGPQVHPVYPLYPPLVESYAAPPSFGAVNFHQEHYPHETFHGVDGPYYDPYVHRARAQTLPARVSKDLKISSGFSPSKVDKN